MYHCAGDLESIIEIRNAQMGKIELYRNGPEKADDLCKEYSDVEYCVLFAVNLRNPLPASIFQLSKVRLLDLSSNLFQTLPKTGIEALKQLRELRLHHNDRLEEFPAINHELLEIVDLSHCPNLQKMPKRLPSQLLSLDISQCTKLGTEGIPRTVPKMLRNLDMTNCSISALEDDFFPLGSHLVFLKLNENQLRVIPRSVGNLEQLKEFHVRENLVERLPDELSRASELDILCCEHNRLANIPRFVGAPSGLSKLREVRTHANLILDPIPADHPFLRIPRERRTSDFPDLILPADSKLGALWLGSDRSMLSKRFLVENDIGFVLSVMRTPVPIVPMDSIERLHVDVRDSRSQDIGQFWAKTNAFIERARKSQRACLVHCRMGVSRSCSCVASYMLWSQRATLRAIWMREVSNGNANSNVSFIALRRVLDWIRRRRAQVSPNTGFMRQLESYCHALHEGRIGGVQFPRSLHAGLLGHTTASAIEPPRCPFSPSSAADALVAATSAMAVDTKTS